MITIEIGDHDEVEKYSSFELEEVKKIINVIIEQSSRIVCSTITDTIQAIVNVECIDRYNLKPIEQIPGTIDIKGLINTLEYSKNRSNELYDSIIKDLDFIGNAFRKAIKSEAIRTIDREQRIRIKQFLISIFTDIIN